MEVLFAVGKVIGGILVLIILFLIHAIIVSWIRHKRGEDAGANIDLNHAWSLSDIGDADRFFEWLFAAVPDGSVFVIEGAVDDEAAIFCTLRKYATDDEFKVSKGTLFPRSNVIKLQLTKQNKADIIDDIKDTAWSFVHTAVYHDKTVLTQSWDGLESASIRKSLPLNKVNEAVKAGLFEYEDENRPHKQKS